MPGVASSAGLAAGEILVVLRERAGVDVASFDGLPAGDRQRAADLSHAGRRAAFVAGRRLLYDVVGQMSGVSAEALACRPEPNGRPVLLPPCDRLAISISHGDRHDAVAVSGRGAVGLDIEDRLPLGRDGMAETVMTDLELAAYRAMAADRREKAFCRLWTRKEALLKAAGTGFLVDPRCVAVGFEPGPVRLGAIDGLPGGPWIVHDVEAPVPCAVAACDLSAVVRLVIRADVPVAP